MSLPLQSEVYNFLLLLLFGPFTESRTTGDKKERMKKYKKKGQVQWQREKEGGREACATMK